MNLNNPSEQDLEKAMRDAESDVKKEDNKPMAEKLLDIFLKNSRVELFHTERREPFIRFPVAAHHEHAHCNINTLKFLLSNT